MNWRGERPAVAAHFRAAAFDDGDYVGVSELASAAGDGAVVDHERVTGRIKFRRAWLDRHGLVARTCRIIQVSGESMEPTLVDGCSILVNHASRRRRVGHLFVVRTDGGLVVKRAGRDASGAWQLVSDNPNTHVWPMRPWPPDAVVVGEVKWAAADLCVRRSPKECSRQRHRQPSDRRRR